MERIKWNSNKLINPNKSHIIIKWHADVQHDWQQRQKCKNNTVELYIIYLSTAPSPLHPYHAPLVFLHALVRSTNECDYRERKETVRKVY